MTPLLYNKSICIDSLNYYLRKHKLSARLFSDQNVEELFPLFQACEEFIALVFNHKKTELEAINFIHDLPKNHSNDNKLPIGIYNEQEKLIAVLDLIKSYPNKGSWYIGLLLSLPSMRCKGFGSIMVACVEQTILAFGGSELNLIVQNNNHRALMFWEKLGFVLMRESLQKLDHSSHIVSHFRKLLSLEQ